MEFCAAAFWALLRVNGTEALACPSLKDFGFKETPAGSASVPPGREGPPAENLGKLKNRPGRPPGRDSGIVYL